MIPDRLERRCPRLGGDVAFGYCKACGQEKSPCFKVFDCWWERFDVVTHLQTCLPPDAFDALCASRPRPKVTSLLEVIQQAQMRVSQQ